MAEPAKRKVAVEEKLGVNKFHTDEHNSHIDVDKEYPSREEIQRVIRICPAGLYKLDDDGVLFFDYLGCLECGSCRVISGGKVIREWNYPVGGLGIEYRLG